MDDFTCTGCSRVFTYWAKSPFVDMCYACNIKSKVKHVGDCWIYGKSPTLLHVYASAREISFSVFHVENLTMILSDYKILTTCGKNNCIHPEHLKKIETYKWEDMKKEKEKERQRLRREADELKSLELKEKEKQGLFPCGYCNKDFQAIQSSEEGIVYSERHYCSLRHAMLDMCDIDYYECWIIKKRSFGVVTYNQERYVLKDAAIKESIKITPGSLDRSCKKNDRCVNPEHLLISTNAEKILSLLKEFDHGDAFKKILINKLLHEMVGCVIVDDFDKTASIIGQLNKFKDIA